MAGGDCPQVISSSHELQGGIWIHFKKSRLSDSLVKELELLEDIERVAFRLGGLEVYVIVGVLISTASYGSIISDGLEKLDNGTASAMSNVTLLVGASSTLLSLYATVIFCSSVLYGKTAVGMNRDDMYAYFMVATANQRYRAFQALSASLFLFSIEVLLVLGTRLPKNIYLRALHDYCLRSHIPGMRRVENSC